MAIDAAAAVKAAPDSGCDRTIIAPNRASDEHLPAFFAKVVDRTLSFTRRLSHAVEALERVLRITLISSRVDARKSPNA
jgi:hypothetical protein